MICLSYFSPAPGVVEAPEEFPSPLNAVPHPLARHASQLLQQTLSSCAHDFTSPEGGKMLGVLVVRDADKRLAYLSAFSGMLAGRWRIPGFVPPVFDDVAQADIVLAAEVELEACSRRIDELLQGEERRSLLARLARMTARRDAAVEALRTLHKQRKAKRRAVRASIQTPDDDSVALQSLLQRLSFESQEDKRRLRACRTRWDERLTPLRERLDDMDRRISMLGRERARQSRRWHKQIFNGYVLVNALGERRPIRDFFAPGLPPGGSGDCVAPKLLHYAHRTGLVPVAMAEFWWGSSPSDSIRHHGHYYPACRSKCQPILPFLLSAMKVQPASQPGAAHVDSLAPEIVYEDDDLIVVNKPSGLLSVPGKEIDDCVISRLRSRYHSDALMMVHRLDMATSGLLIVAKRAPVHKALQRQFLSRTIEKRYVAILSKPPSTSALASHPRGTIKLPLRVDLADRPRQLVCFEHGKPATTHWERLSAGMDTLRVYFYPLTGRTHQLRVHAAHKDGLNAPIVGDDLYGRAGTRLMLHAERLCFTQPLSGKRVEIEAPAPF